MGNTLPQERSFSSQLKDKTCSSKELSLYHSREIKQIFTNYRRESLIVRTSDVKKFVKNRKRFYETLEITLGYSIRSKKEINTVVSASKDRKLASRLCVSFSDSANAKDFREENIKKFSVVLNSQRNISTLSLDFCIDSNLTQEGSKFLVSALRSMFLSELSLSFTNCWNMPEEVFLTLFSCLKHLVCLSSFTLKLCRVMTLKLTGIKELISGLRGLRQLKRLKISDQRSGIGSEGIEELFSGLGKLKHISHLSLDFDDLPQDIIETLLKSVSVTFASLKYLISLELILDFGFKEKEGPDGRALTYISSGLQNLTSLKSLTLSLRWGLPSTENELNNFSETLREMKSLQKLNLRLFTEEFNDKFYFVFKDLKMLKHLSLFFDITQEIPDQGLENFFLTFKDMRALSALKLDFSFSLEFDKKVLHSLYENLKEVCSLRYLSLKIYVKKGLEEKEKNDFISKFGDVKVEMEV